MQNIDDALEAVNRGHWLDNRNGTISCSHCHTWFYKNDRYSKMRYCPYCKLKMAESEDEIAKKDTDKVLEMAKDIINLKLRLIRNSIGGGNCPFAVSPLKTRLNIDCNTADCRDCNDIWAKAKRKEIAEEVIAQYDLQESE